MVIHLWLADSFHKGPIMKKTLPWRHHDQRLIIWDTCRQPCVWQYLIMHDIFIITRLSSFINLTHWGRDKMDAISQTTPSSAFSWMKIFEFRIKFQWSFVPKCPINNKPALVQIMAWCRPGDKPLSEPMMVSLPTHICVARPQWVNPCRAEIYIGIFDIF